MRILAASAIALGLGLATEQAHATQTFICEDGRLLQIELQNLEQMKRVETCVAAAYGLKVSPVPLPVKRPHAAATPRLKGTQKAAEARRPIGALAQTTSTYRSVRIINAKPGSRRWFKHTR